MNKKLLFFLCSITSLCYASENSSAWDAFTVQGGRPYQEDWPVVCSIDKKNYLFGVLDGHAGADVAKYVGKNLPLKFGEYLDQSLTEKQAFEEAFCYVEKHALNSLKGGSTAVFVYIANRVAHVANVGDSRAVFGAKNTITFATRDQTLERADERQRVLQADGIIYRVKSITNEMLGPWRINGLVMSRTMGDAWSKGRENRSGCIQGLRNMSIDGKAIMMLSQQWPNIDVVEEKWFTPEEGQIIADPEYTERQLTDTDRWLIIASDGLWDEVDSEEALTIVQDYYDKQGSLQGIAYFLCECAMTRKSADNITVIVVDLLHDLLNKTI